MRRLLAFVGISALTSGSLLAFTAAGAAADPIPTTFGFTGAMQSYTVPANVCAVTITADGGDGGDGAAVGEDAGGTGATAATVTARVAVTPGSTLAVIVAPVGVD